MLKPSLVLACAISAFPPVGTRAHVASDKRENEPTSVGEVIVTATKRETRLEDTPVAITAITSGTIDAQRLYNFADIAKEAPGLVFTPHGKQETYLSIRGTNQDNGAAGADQGVSVFIDDVPTIGVGDNNPDLFDLQSIEVLRGPQGTLFGRNVTGGAVVVRTLAPSFTTQVKAQATYGAYNLAEFRGYLTGPIVADTLAGKITLELRRQDGIIDNTFLHTKDGATRSWAARAQLLYFPVSNLKVLFGVDYAQDTSAYKVQQLVGDFQPSLFPPLSYGPSNTNQALPSQGNSKIGGAVARIEYQIPLGTLTSISGLRYVDELTKFSTSADPLNQIISLETQQDTQFTQEIRIASPDNRKLTWVAGFFFLDSHRRYREDQNIMIDPGTVASFVDPYTNPNYLAVNDQHVTGHSYAVFGEGAYALVRHLKLTLGARYTIEDKSGHTEVFDTSGLTPPLYAPHYRQTWRAFTPKATLTFQPNEDFLTYFTVASGFKSGGFDVNGSDAVGLATPFKPEKVLSYEGGIKAAAFDRRLVVNIAAYYATYKDLQINEFVPRIFQYVTGNAGSADIPGVEIEATAIPAPWLSLNGSFSYIGANYTRYMPDSMTDFSGHQIPFAAKYQYHFGADAHRAIPQLGGGEVWLGGDVTFQSRRYFNSENNSFPFIIDRTPINGVVNLHATWKSPGDTWEISLWGKNVTDTRTIIFATDLTAFFATPAEFAVSSNRIYDVGWTPPAMYGVTLTFRR